jgi:3D (Asp-Asp-Asp) domain-containing protein
MLQGRRSRAVRFGALAAVLALTAASAALAAPGSGQPEGASSASGTAQQLDTRTHQALLSLYSLDSQLQSWRARLASLETAAAALRERRAELRTGLAAARATLRTGQHRLALELRVLYERGNIDPVAVVLGAKSLSTGLNQLDDLSRAAGQSRQVIAAASAAHRRLLESQLRLAVEQRRLERSLAAARQAEERLAAAAASRAAYVSSLRAQELRAQQVRSVEAGAQAAEQKTQQIQPTTSTPAPPTGKRRLTVSATCYDLSGRTATGMPVGEGVVAVDPSVIPLGTRMYVPGYGNGVAADVGGGIKGDIIDLWMTPSQCAAWGRRTVTITLN